MKTNLTHLARGLRARQTDAETALWFKLCNRQLEGAKFRRQQQIGNYIVYFVCLEKKVIIEVDGGQHNKESYKEQDERRDLVLEQKGYCVLRYWDSDVLQNIEGILEHISIKLM